MDNKPKNKAGKGYSAPAESSAAETDSFKRASDLLKKHTEKFGKHMEELFSQEPDSNTVHSFRSVPSVHNFGDMEALSSAPDSDTGTDNTIWRNFADHDNLKSTSDCNEHAEKSSNVNNLSWEVTSLIGDKKVKEPMPLTAVGTKESLLSLSGTPTSATRIGLFFKDKHELPSDLYTVNTFSDNLSYGSARTQELAEDLGISTQSTSPGTLQISVNNPQFLVDSNLDIALSHIPHMKADPGCLPSLADESTGNMGYVQQPSKNMSTFMSDPIELSIPATSSNSQFWCQSNLREYTHLRTGYRTPGAIQNTCMANAPHKAYSAYLGALPQRVCIICGDEASGCHYGVLTCGSCKVFFKRAVEGHHNYLCAGRNDCIVDKIRRKNCPACRLRKCYQAGMMLGGRKLKKFGAQNTMGVTKPLLVGSPQCLPWASQALVPLPCMPGIQELQFSPQIISILENIEPDVVYSGYDNSQPDMPNLLLNSLNRLCERQLVWIVKWSKSLPGFRSLHINDQMTLIQYSWMSLMVFSLGWRSFQNVTSEYLYFAPDLILNEEGMKKSPIYDLCLSMQFIPQAFSKLQVTKEEFLCMKALLLLNTVPLEGLQSQAQFEEMRQSYIGELTKAIHLKEKGVVASSQRFYHLTKLMDHMHDIVKKLNLYCLSTFIQAESMRVEFPEMMTEVIASQLPKVLAGMVKPLLFHNK